MQCTSLDQLAGHLDGCQRCRLGTTRQRLVFGEGNADARLMLIGEGPGADEDRSGRPFVGQAGQLLDAMILALGLRREQVYIANVVKCRPPANRAPNADETAACAPFLDRQIDLVKPDMILALGRPAAQRLTGETRPLGAMRGRWRTYRGVPVLPTFHPAYLLRNPADKRLSWEDLKLVRERLSGAAGGPPEG
jgi:DNA polymerase